MSHDRLMKLNALCVCFILAILHRFTNWKTFLIKRLTGSKTLPPDFSSKVPHILYFRTCQDPFVFCPVCPLTFSWPKSNVTFTSVFRITLSLTLHHQVQASMQFPFKKQMRVEVVDKTHLCRTRVAVVEQVRLCDACRFSFRPSIVQTTACWRLLVTQWIKRHFIIAGDWRSSSAGVWGVWRRNGRLLVSHVQPSDPQHRLVSIHRTPL